MLPSVNIWKFYGPTNEYAPKLRDVNRYDCVFTIHTFSSDVESPMNVSRQLVLVNNKKCFIRIGRHHQIQMVLVTPIDKHNAQGLKQSKRLYTHYFIYYRL